MPNLPLLNTSGFEWVDPGETNPKGWLAGRPKVHPYGGLIIRDDAEGQGIAAHLLGAPRRRTWKANTPIVGMPLQVTDEGELWAPPYPLVQHAQLVVAGLAVGAPSGDADDATPITPAAEIAMTNGTAYEMLVARRVVIRDARMITPRKPVSYGLLVDGVGWPLYSGNPDHHQSIIASTDTGTIDGVETEFVTGISTINVIAPAEHVYSGSIELPSLIIDPGETLTMAVQTAIFYQENDTDPFNVHVGETTLELWGWSIATSNFGQEV